MACETWASLIVDRITDELDEEASIGLEQHLAECGACRDEEHRVRRLIGAAAPREEWRPSTSLETRLVAELRRRREAPAPAPRERTAAADRVWGLFRRRIPAYVLPALAAAAVVLGIWIGSVTGPTGAGGAEGPLATPPEEGTGIAPADRWDGAPAARPGESLASLPGELLGRSRFLATPADAVLGAEVIYADSL